MDTVINLSVYSDNEAEARQALNKAEAAFMAVERLTSRFAKTDGGEIPQGSLSFLNSHSGEFTVVDAELWDLLKFSLQWSLKTEGAFDISLGRVSELWDFPGGGRVPTPEEIAEALSLCGYEKIILDEKSRAVKIPQGMRLDMGAVAKGYGVDVMARVLTEEGIEHGIINAGGNVFTLNRKPSGELYTVGIVNPLRLNEVWRTVKTANEAVVTSGSYQRFFYGADGILYHHILNPASGYPAEDCFSVSVIAKSSAEADILSTALFVMGKEKGEEFSANIPDIEVIFFEE
jgi:thiamine biosynthesis lipoprotein